MKLNPTYIMAQQANQSGLLDKLFKVGAVVGIFFVGRKFYKDWQANKTSDAAGGDPNIQSAIKIKEAIQGPGTSEKELFAAAQLIQNWSEVTKAYRKLYNSNLIDDVKNDLSASDFNKFLNLYNFSKRDESGNVVSQKNTVKKGVWVFIEKEANIRKTPKYFKLTDSVKEFLKNPLLMSKGKNTSNVIMLAKPGKYIGFATGRTAADAESPQGTLYLEFGTVGIDLKTKKAFNTTAWVASSQVRTEVKPFGTKPNLKDFHIITKQSYDFALSGIGDNTNYQAELHTNKPTVAVLDKDGNLTGFAYGIGTILGYKEAEYSQGNKDYFVFKNVQGLTRMVEKREVKEYNAN